MTIDLEVRESRRPVDVAARVLTEVFAPWVINIFASIVIGVAVGTPGWGVFVAVLTGVIPMAVILVGMRQSKIGDHHVTQISERHLLIAGLLVSTVGGLVIMIFGHAPIEMIAFMAAGLVALAVAAVITSAFRWKVSGHAGGLAGVSMVLALAVSPWWLLGLVLTVAVCWSRVHLGDHTKSQVIVGAIAGAIAAGLTYAVIV